MRKASATVRVGAEPVRSDLEFTRRTSQGLRKYRVFYLTREWYFANGNWTAYRWQGSARHIKTNGEVGQQVTTYLDSNFQPDAETVRQFHATACQQIKAAFGLADRIEP